MYIVGALILIALTLSSVLGESIWPKEVPRCSRYKEDFHECLLNATRAAIPNISKGIPSIGLKPLDPLKNIDFSINSDRWPVTLRVDMTDTTITGPSKMLITGIKFDQPSSLLTIEGIHRVLRMFGNYKVRGNVFVFPLNSQGLFDFALSNVAARHTLKISNNTDKQHGKVGFVVQKLDHITMDLKDPSYNYATNRAINRLVNDNWRIITNALTPSMERVIQSTFTKTLQPFFSKFNVNDIFPSDYKTSPTQQHQQYLFHYLQPMYYIL